MFEHGFRIGLVQEIGTGAKQGRVRVRFPDHDQVVSWWLFVCVPKSGSGGKGWWIPDLGEQVLCLMDKYDEDGAVLGAIYSSADVAPSSNTTAPSATKLTPDGALPVDPTPLTSTGLSAMFVEAAGKFPQLNNAFPGISGGALLQAIAFTESTLGANKIGPIGVDGTRCYGVMQINPKAHPGYSPQELISNDELNIRLGAADIAGKITQFGSYDGMAHYKGWKYGYNQSSRSKGQVDAVIAYAQAHPL